MQTINQNVLNSIKERCNVVPAAAHTEFFKIDGVEYAYMTEVEPHFDHSCGDETEWTITFIAARKNYFFIYSLNGERFCVEPELGKPYDFNFKERHAFLMEKNIKHFDNKRIWDEELEPDSKLACIFTIK